MDFNRFSDLSNYFSKDYSGKAIRLLLISKALSATEIASRLNLHIKTVQDFLEGLVKFNIAEKEEILEGRRPFYRYSLCKSRMDISIDFNELFSEEEYLNLANCRIRELQNEDVQFHVRRNNDYITAVSIYEGDGRKKKEWKINLTRAQGRFLFNLPFPTAEPEKIKQLMAESGISPEDENEVLDLIKTLIDKKVIEIKN